MADRAPTRKKHVFENEIFERRFLEDKFYDPSSDIS
jgi:hypothetical protein